MAQVERIEDMQPGDFIQLPAGEWHLNAAAKAMFAKAQKAMAEYSGLAPSPQYQVENEPGLGFKSRLERIR